MQPPIPNSPYLEPRRHRNADERGLTDEVGATPNPTIETLKKIVKGLNVSVDDLIK